MSEEYDNVVDLSAFREQKIREQAEKERLEKEQQDQDDIEQMRIVLINIMEQLGNPEATGSEFQVFPLSLLTIRVPLPPPAQISPLGSQPKSK